MTTVPSSSSILGRWTASLDKARSAGSKFEAKSTTGHRQYVAMSPEATRNNYTIALMFRRCPTAHTTACREADLSFGRQSS